MKLKTCVVIGMLFLAQVTAAQNTTQETKLVGAGRWGHDPDYDFGLHSVAMSADGATAVIGGWGGSQGGSARVFVRSGGVWSQQPSIPFGSDAVDNSAPAYSAAISADGTTAIVGGPLDDSETGAAWVFVRSGGVWSQQGAKLIGQGEDGSSWQGMSVAMSADGTTAVVGGPSGRGAARTGAAWVFTRSGASWSQQGGPLVGDGLHCQAFCYQGYSVGVSGDGNTVIVGAPWAGLAGAAFVYTRSAGVWSQQGMLVGGDSDTGASQGWSVAISADGTTAIVGGPRDGSDLGAAWVFASRGGAWSQQGPKLVGTGAVGHAAQGQSVAISPDGDTAILGGPWDDSGAGAAWLFTRSAGAWSQTGSKLVGSGAVDVAYQGVSVAVSAGGAGAAALVGGPGDADWGSAWVYQIPPAPRWVPVAAHDDGPNGSRWRTDVGLLNLGSGAATVEVRFHGSDGEITSSTSVPAGAQSVLSDVVGQLGASGQGALEIVTDRTLKLTARTYHQAAADAGCLPDGTQGQDYPVLGAGDGLETGQSAHLPALVENDEYRCNIGVVNTGAGGATVLVELYDGGGTKLAEYTMRLAPGQWVQKVQPFRAKAGVTAMDSGYARVTVQSGSGVIALASVIDNVTNDPTTVTMQR